MPSKLPISLPAPLSLKFIKEACNSGDLQRARHMFDQIPQPDLRTWTILISAYTQLLSAAKACATLGDIVKAKEVHDDAIRFGFHSDTLLGNALIDMYAKCKRVEDARRVFDGMLVKDVISWTSLSSCYVTYGLPRQGLVDAIGRIAGSRKLEKT